MTPTPAPHRQPVWPARTRLRCTLVAGLSAVVWLVGASMASAQNLDPAPVVFNHPASARAGDVVGLQGDGFGANPVVALDGRPGEPPTELPLINQHKGMWVSFRIPPTASGALVVRVRNGTVWSAPVALNAARALHLDTRTLVPGGAFRVFGRSLRLEGSTPTLTVDGLPARLDLGQSDEHMLVATAPPGLRPTASAQVVVDNGNVSGAARLERATEVAAVTSDDVFKLGVGWASAFAPLLQRSWEASTDPRLPRRMACDGASDDTAALQAAIDRVAHSGGVLRLPAGTCRLKGSAKLRSRVVLQGAGMARTVLAYEGNYPLWARGLDLIALRDLTLHNQRGPIESPLVQSSTRVVLQNVRFLLGGGVHMFLTDNRQMVVTASEFEQPTNPNGQGAYVLNGTGGLVFTHNTTTFSHGGTAFARVHDAYIAHNRFTRDVRGLQDAPGVLHSLAMDFAHRVAIVDNLFDVLGGPVTNKVRNDGETLLTEGGGGRRTENLGYVASATASTLLDPGNRFNLSPFTDGVVPENMGVAIVGGHGAGQTRRVTGAVPGGLAVEPPWQVVPDQSSRYATFVWGLEKSLIKGNRLLQNPRGIWFYQTAVRDVDVVDNTIEEGGGIYLRSAQNLRNRLFTPIYGVRIANNHIKNTSREWPSYVHVGFVRMDEADFGLGTIGVELRGNTLLANQPNLSLASEESGRYEGYLNLARFEGLSQARAHDQERLLGTVLQDNVCIGCELPVRVRDGATATVLQDNSALPHTGQ